MYSQSMLMFEFVNLSEIFKVASVELKTSDTLSCEVFLADGEKCNRCKRYTDDVNTHPYWPGEKYRMCHRCINTLLEMQNFPPFILRSETDYYICKNEIEWQEIKMGLKGLPQTDA